jgi:hypothetical protein
MHEKADVPNYALTPCYLRTSRRQPEKDFEAVLQNSSKVKWWYKNGTNKEMYFAIPYTDPLEKVARSFYPDFIVHFVDGTTGIYDTKAGFTAESEETAVKSDELQEYIKKHKDKKLTGGIVVSKPSGMFVFTGSRYNKETTAEGWNRIDL